MRESGYALKGVGLALLWLLVVVGLHAALVEFGYLLNAAQPGLLHGDSETWYMAGTTWLAVSGGIALLASLTFDVFGAPVWHRVPGLVVLTGMYLAFEMPFLSADGDMGVGAEAVLFLRWACVTGAVLAATALLYPRVAAIRERFTPTRRYLVGATVVLLVSAYFMPALLSPPPPVPPGVHEEILLTDVSVRDGRLSAKTPQPIHSGRDLEYSLRSSRTTRFMVKGNAVTAVDFTAAHSQTPGGYVWLSVKEAGVATRLVLLEP